MDGTRIPLNDSGNPVNEAGETYLILGADEGGGGEDRNGDLADCGFVSNLWQPEVGLAYPYDPAIPLEKDENGDFIYPTELALGEAGGDAFQLVSGRIVADCEIIEMPPRTSQAHYDFIAKGANAGAGYGEGGLSGAGMMPGFEKMLTPEMIQAVVDYERGL